MKKTAIKLLCNQFLLISVISGIMLSCKKNEVQVSDPDLKDESLYAEIIKGGISDTAIKDINGYYLVEGDLLFKKHATNVRKVAEYFKNKTLNNDLVVKMNQSGSGIPRTANGKIASSNRVPSISQWHTYNLISTENVENIRVNTDASPWAQATKSAINNWISIPDCKINFYEFWGVNSTDANSITFVDSRNDPELAGSYAIAQFPSNDWAGYRIRINTNYTNLSVSQQTFILTHEIGHCIGLRHTNWQGYELQNPDGAILIPGTPTNDNLSIMNRGGAPTVPNWLGFSNYDVVAAQFLYPYGLYDQWLADIPYFAGYNENPPPPVTWNTNLVNTPTVSFELFQYGRSLGIVASNVPNTGSYVINYRQYVQPLTHNWPGVQVKIISDANPSISDLSRMFYFFWD